jgi:hypothetical protein
MSAPKHGAMGAGRHQRGIAAGVDDVEHRADRSPSLLASSPPPFRSQSCSRSSPASRPLGGSRPFISNMHTALWCWRHPVIGAGVPCRPRHGATRPRRRVRRRPRNWCSRGEASGQRRPGLRIGDVAELTGTTRRSATTRSDAASTPDKRAVQPTTRETVRESATCRLRSCSASR